MKRFVEYPEWAEKYRAKGRTIRKVRDGYGLYECTSVYVKGQKYPKSRQKYLGMITEKDGFIPKGHSVSSKRQYLEYGLSHFIMANFKRDLIRCLYMGTEEMAILGVIYFIFESVDEVFIKATYLSHGIEDKLITRVNTGVPLNRMKTVSKKINALLEENIPDEHDRLILTKLLMISVIDKDSEPESYSPFPEAEEITERYGLKL